MRKIDMDNWSRREHFNLFNNFDQPHFNMCVNMDLTAFFPAVKQSSASFTVATTYVITRAANDIRQFRYRIRDNEVIEHDVVHPSTTILVDEDTFSFCIIDYAENFKAYADRAVECIAYAKENSGLIDPAGRDDFLYMTAIPWVSFTSFMHPMHYNPSDSVPRFAWGKFFEEGDKLKMPLSVQGHHAVMDGLHMGQYYAKVQGYLDNPDFLK